MKDKSTEKIDCFQCEHFNITWESKTPRACKLYGFKTASMPSVVFYNTTGSQCVGFKKKRDKQI